MVKVLVKKHIDCEKLLGSFIELDQADEIITEDTDLYAESVDGSLTEDNIIFKYRKNAFTEDEQSLAYQGLRPAAAESQNRGLAAGPRGERLHAKSRGGRDWVTTFHYKVLEFLCRPDNLLGDEETMEEVIAKWKGSDDADTRGRVWLRSEVCKVYDPYEGWFERWLEEIRHASREEQRKEAEHVSTNYISDTNYAQSVMSGIAGYFDRYPRIPYGRATSYTEKNSDLFKLCFPYIQKLETIFKAELPERWGKQRAAADRIDKRFRIDGSCYTTLTVNHNWRTAAHRDAGDLHAGFSNITAFSKDGGWKGGEFILPEFRVAVKLKPRDLLLVNNHDGIHGNAPLLEDNNDRLTIVAYLREKMLELKSWEYENCRRNFIDKRRLDRSHPLWRPLWNGVSPSWDTSDEWYEFLRSQGLEDPYNRSGNSLEEFLV